MIGLRLGRAFLFASLMAGALAHADKVVFLPDALEAAKARLDLIREAKHEILVSTYVLTDDRIGQTAIALLRDAARSGKRVVLIADDVLLNIDKAALAALVRDGVQVKIFRPIKYREGKLGVPLNYLNRMHDKLFIVDGENLITGDRNIANDYYGLGDEAFVGKETYVQGEAAARAREYFEDMVARGDVSPFEGTGQSAEAVAAANRQLDEAIAKLPRRILETRVGWRERLREVGEVEFFHDEPGAKSSLAGSGQVVLDAIRTARSTLFIENPYIVLGEDFRKALREAAARGVKITVFTNSTLATNQKLVGIAWSDSRDFLETIGADVWELQRSNEGKARKGLRAMGDTMDAETSLHSKTMIVDGQRSYVMTYNMDPRSQNLNTELGVVISDAGFAREIMNRIEIEKTKLAYKHTVIGGVRQSGIHECPWILRLLLRPLTPQL